MRTETREKSLEYNNRFCNSGRIRRRTETLAQEKIRFKDGTALGNINVQAESGGALRMVRRIIEKRVSQSLRRRDKNVSGNFNRFQQRRWMTNYMKNLYGFVPGYCGGEGLN